MNHLVQHIHHPQLTQDNTLHVVSVVSNPVRYQSRYRLAREFISRMRATPHVKLHLVEAVFGDRQPEMDADLTLRTSQSIWIKENMINLGVRHLLPVDWRYVAWVDADIEFRDPQWAQEALHQLQHFEVIQPWSHCADLGPHGEISHAHTGFGYLHQKGVRKQETHDQPYQYAHSGFAWASTRAFWERIGGLPDYCLLGSADHHAAWAMTGKVETTIPAAMPASYHRRLKEFQSRALPACNGQVGFVNGRIEHHFHGPKAKRYYRSRWEILLEAQYDPDRDTFHDAQGMIQTSNKALDLAIHKYNLARDEDGIND